ncbi:MAG: TIGR00282 family metallophosphoesterase [Spirochaetales bacterium]
MASNSFTVLMVGDVVGQAGLRALTLELAKLRKHYGADFVVVNGENADAGFGMSPENAASIYAAGADVITTGNHVWQHKDIAQLLESDSRILRPANYPGRLSGSGLAVCETGQGTIAVMHLQGRTRMPVTDCPFRKSRELLKSIKNQCHAVVCDFHAEASDEKEALAHYLDGQLALLCGTHTHVQTADERILSRGTAYITDLGMTGPDDSVIGFRTDISIRRSLTQMPLKNEVSNEAATVHGVAVSIDMDRQVATSIERFKAQPGV